MNYNSLMNKPTINYRELIGDNTVTEVGGITEEQFNTLLNTDLSSYYTKAQIDDLFSRSYVYREKSGSIVTFDCPASVNGIDKVVTEIVAVQSGSGDPSPTNIRPITGWSAVNVIVSPTLDVEDGTTYTTTLKDGQGNPLTCYGGTLDVVNGVLMVDRVEVIYDGSSDENWAKVGSTSASAFAMCIDSPFVYMITDVNQIKCNYLKTILSNATWGNEDSWVSYTVVGGVAKLCTGIQSITEVEDWKSYLSSNNLQIVYKLATPQTIQLTPTAVKSLLGVNNIWCNSGDITVKALDRIIQG